MDQTREFLSAVWPEGVPEGHRLLLWTLQDIRSHWARSIDEAASIAQRLAPTRDVYLGIGAGRMPDRDAVSHRLKAAEVLTLPAFGADFDLDGPGHKKSGLFRSEEEILELIGKLPLQPTVLVHTGGGLQAWWCFKEPWELESDAERAHAERLSRGWANFLRSEARARGRELDAVWDLARVLRVPGTFNHKLAQKRPVHRMEHRR